MGLPTRRNSMIWSTTITSPQRVVTDGKSPEILDNDAFVSHDTDYQHFETTGVVGGSGRQLCLGTPLT